MQVLLSLHYKNLEPTLMSFKITLCRLSKDVKRYWCGDLHSLQHFKR